MPLFLFNEDDEHNHGRKCNPMVMSCIREDFIARHMKMRCGAGATARASPTAPARVAVARTTVSRARLRGCRTLQGVGVLRQSAGTDVRGNVERRRQHALRVNLVVAARQHGPVQRSPGNLRRWVRYCSLSLSRLRLCAHANAEVV